MLITYANVKNELPNIIDEEGDEFVYLPPFGSNGTCRYVHNGTGSCLIGRYLISKGVPIENFERHEGQDVSDAIDTGLLEGTGITVEPEAIMAMNAVQYHQDNTEEWGVAYSKVFEH